MGTRRFAGTGKVVLGAADIELSANGSSLHHSLAAQKPLQGHKGIQPQKEGIRESTSYNDTSREKPNHHPINTMTLAKASRIENPTFLCG